VPRARWGSRCKVGARRTLFLMHPSGSPKSGRWDRDSRRESGLRRQLAAIVLKPVRRASGGRAARVPSTRACEVVGWPERFEFVERDPGRRASAKVPKTAAGLREQFAQEPAEKLRAALMGRRWERAFEGSATSEPEAGRAGHQGAEWRGRGGRLCQTSRDVLIEAAGGNPQDF